MKYKHSRKKVISKYKLKPNVDPLVIMLLEPAKWPQEGDEYWFISMELEIIEESFGHEYFKRKLGLEGNCFRTKKEATKARDKIKKLLKK